MPELPEVETIARHLREGHDGAPSLAGKQITSVTIRWPRHIARPSTRSFRRRMRSRTIREVGRRGKYLVFGMDQGSLLVHLKMSGELYLAPAGHPRQRFDRTVFHLRDGWELRFSDSRKFGRVFWVEDPKSVLEPLGPEPFSGEFTSALLGERLRSRRRSLKPLLLDQTFVAGLGNIYADEALHRARLHPLRRSDRLSDEEVERLWRGIQAALSEGLDHNGASIDWVYRGGDFQNHFRVYQRTGEPCPVCGTPIRRRVIGQRSSHFCPSCQPARRR